IRSRKPELRRTHRTLRTTHILSLRRTLGRILCEHARTGLRVSLPDTTLTLLQVTLNSKVLCDVRSLSRALPYPSLDLGPHSYGVSSVRSVSLERDRTFHP